MNNSTNTRNFTAPVSHGLARVCRPLVSAVGLLLCGGWLAFPAQADPPTSAALTSLHSFSTSETLGSALVGYAPQGLTAGPDGNFYLVTDSGGDNGGGTVLKFQTSTATFSVLHAFSGSSSREENLLATADGTLYGTAAQGGASASGLVYRLATDGGGYTELHSFSDTGSTGFNADGSYPSGALVQDADGTLYGEAEFGGGNGQGDLYKMSADGSSFTVLHTFGSGTDGAYPAGGLLAGPGGFLYGVAQSGGAGGTGTVFKIKSDGTAYTVLHEFSDDGGQLVNTDGVIPAFKLTLGRDGLLYDTTISGGDSGNGVLFRLGTDGSGFAALYAFTATDSSAVNADGASPCSGLVEDAEGNFYGTTSSGGANGQGVLFGLTADGSLLTTLYSLSSADGSEPVLTADRSGLLFGTAATGGDSGFGSLFLVSLHHPATHVLWTNADGRVSVWNYSLTGSFTQNTYGPYGGWSAKAIADGPDSLTRVLWTNTNGTASIWSLDNTTGRFTQNSFGPYGGWTASTVSVGTDNTTHVLWKNADGRASLWNYRTADGTFTQNTYGPYAGWSASAAADGPDALTRVLWTNTNGTTSIWSLDNSMGRFTQNTYGPYSGWTSANLSVGIDNTTHILWNNTSGQMSLWNYDTGSGAFTQNSFGPYGGWSAKAVADGSDALTRVLWTNTDGRASIWGLDNQYGAFTQNTYGPYSGWTAKGISAGQ